MWEWRDGGEEETTGKYVSGRYCRTYEYCKWSRLVAKVRLKDGEWENSRDRAEGFKDTPHCVRMV